MAAIQRFRDFRRKRAGRAVSTVGDYTIYRRERGGLTTGLGNLRRFDPKSAGKKVEFNVLNGEGVPVGMATLKKGSSKPSNLFVKNELRGKGIGRIMHGLTMAEMKAQGRKELIAPVSEKGLNLYMNMAREKGQKIEVFEKRTGLFQRKKKFVRISLE